ncbi:uncharacterized protein LOC117118588 isoform X2 [Anneissia japonica]|uniref:uncharacterized protein LOC117118588 isoform X2 n=1 Tax=Anneissia japonica TaxID=1529436 RepID=UPI0014256512|nr:uncharacterized protein LOC117118588 isoform X2 [Anneissia japonica]
MAAVVLLVWCKSLEDNNLKRKSASFLLPNEQLSGGGSSAASDHVAMTTQLSTSGISTMTQGRTDVQFVEPFTPESKPVVATSTTPTTNGHQRHFQTMTPQPTRIQSASPNLYAPRRPAPKTPNGVNGAAGAKPLSAKLQAEDTSPESLDLLFTEYFFSSFPAQNFCEYWF